MDDVTREGEGDTFRDEFREVINLHSRHNGANEDSVVDSDR